MSNYLVSIFGSIVFMMLCFLVSKWTQNAKVDHNIVAKIGLSIVSIIGVLYFAWH